MTFNSMSIKVFVIFMLITLLLYESQLRIDIHV